MIRNIIFDWCGTLVDDLEAVWKATNQTFQHAGVAPLTLETFRQEFSLPFRPFYERYIPDVDEAQLEKWYFAAFEQEQNSIKPFAESPQFLDFCQSRGIEMFVLSSIHQRHFVAHIERTGFGPYFREAYVGVHDKRHEILRILETHKLAPDETLFVGDMQHDIETAKYGGIRSCGVLTGFNTKEQLQESEPDIVVRHLGELQALLEAKNGALNKTETPTPADQPGFPLATVGALIIDPHDRVLMIQTHKWSNKWGIPGGKIHLGESSEAALRREIREETNLNVDEIHFVMVQDAVFPKEFYRDNHFILLNYTCSAVPPLETRLNHEAEHFQWLSPEAALALELNEPTRILLETVLAAPDQFMPRRMACST